MHHAFESLVPEDEHFARHPEYFGVLGGRRVAGTGSQLCLSNAEVVRIVSERAVRYFDEHPEATFFSLCPNDNQNWCECDECRALDTETMERWGKTFPVVSDRYFAFVNQVADALAERHPQKLLYTFAYQNYTWPPKKHLPRENVIVSLCHMVPACYSHELTDRTCPKNTEFDALLSDWAATDASMWYYAYTCKSMWEQMPWPIARRLAADIQRLHEAGFQGFYSQGSQGIWGQLGVNFHLMAQMLWEPETDVDAALDEYLELAFGPAAEPMERFYEALEAGFSAEGVHVHHEADIWGPQVMTAAVRSRCDEALAEAVKLAGGDADVLARIAPVAGAYRYACLRVDALAGEQRWEADGDEAGLKAAARAYRDIAALAGENPGGQSITMGSVRRYVTPRYDRLALPYDALFAPPEEREYEWTPLIPTSTFEAGDPDDAAWALAQAQEDCGAEPTSEAAHQGDASLRLWSTVESEQSPRWTALQHGWIIVSSMSKRFPVETGDAIVATAWVRVPADIEETTRGVTLGVVGYDADGKSPRGWTPGSIETGRLAATDGWRRIAVARTIDNAAVTEVALRLALGGVGEGYIDEVALLRGLTASR